MGSARGAARSSRADLGLALGGPGAAWWRARPCADVGIAAATCRRTAAGRGRTELGRSGARGWTAARSSGACGCICPVLGRAAACFRTAAGCASRAHGRPAAARPRLGRAFRLDAIVGGTGG